MRPKFLWISLEMQFSLLYFKPNFIDYFHFPDFCFWSRLRTWSWRSSCWCRWISPTDIRQPRNLSWIQRFYLRQYFNQSWSISEVIRLFLDDDGNKILDSSDFQDKSIQITEYEETIISFQLRQNIFPYTMLISGLGVGQTFAKLQLNHGGYPDYTATNKIPVTVE